MAKPASTSLKEAGGGNLHGLFTLDGKIMPTTILDMKPVDQVLGARVAVEKGDEIGRIDNLVLDLESGRIAYAIVTRDSGTLGGNARLFPVPWAALHQSAQANTYVIDATTDILKNAPSFDNSHLPDWTNVKWNDDLYAHYKLHPWWEHAEREQEMQEAEAPQAGPQASGLLP
jgi:sporulation protein YlmC with PRC-barrel domain